MINERLAGAEQVTLNPAALSVEDAARVLGLAVETVRRDVAEGAPTAADGTINLVHYVAWLNRELAARTGQVEADDLSAEARRAKSDGD
jgi:DeoR/GlpR family transcriptional regulator of sugar metabolism